MSQAITPFLWFDGKAEEAMNYYCSTFKDSEAIYVFPIGPEGMSMCRFRIKGVEFQALDGGPMYQMTPGTSFFVDCADQEEIDHLWSRLSDGGTEMQCGWLTDKFGVTWQIIPDCLGQLMGDPDPAKSSRVQAAMLQMVKFDIQALKDAHEGK